MLRASSSPDDEHPQHVRRQVQPRKRRDVDRATRSASRPCDRRDDEHAGDHEPPRSTSPATPSTSSSTTSFSATDDVGGRRGSERLAPPDATASCSCGAIEAVKRRALSTREQPRRSPRSPSVSTPTSIAPTHLSAALGKQNDRNEHGRDRRERRRPRRHAAAPQRPRHAERSGDSRGDATLPRYASPATAGRRDRQPDEPRAAAS